MKNLATVLAFGCLAALGLVGCGGETANKATNAGKVTANAAEKVMNTAANAANTVSNAVTKATMTSPEDFIKNAYQAGSGEVELGKLAQKKSQNTEVKKFAQMMVTDHGSAAKDLEALAAKKNLTLPKDIGSMRSTVDSLSKSSGTDFDKEYVNAMVDDHETDLKEFQSQAQNSADPDVKAFAAKLVPVIQKHLDAIKAIRDKMK